MGGCAAENAFGAVQAPNSSEPVRRRWRLLPQRHYPLRARPLITPFSHHQPALGSRSRASSYEFINQLRVTSSRFWPNPRWASFALISITTISRRPLAVRT